MSETICRYCGPLPDVETDEQRWDHLLSETHGAMVKLAYDLNARVYIPPPAETDE